MVLVLCPTTTLPEYYYSTTTTVPDYSYSTTVPDYSYSSSSLLLLLLCLYSTAILLYYSTGQVSGPVGDVKVKPAIAPTEERMPWD